jgi:predicted metal-dependent TIM-barrel fold hydrolase
VLKKLPAYLEGPTVLGIGEIGMNRVTKNEIATYADHVAMAARCAQLVLIPHAASRGQAEGHRGHDRTSAQHADLTPSRVLVDHAEEHTIALILEHGYWAGLTLYRRRRSRRSVRWT